MAASSDHISPETFMRVVYDHAYLGGVRDAIGSLEQPPGQAPREGLVALHDWYIQLPEHDRLMVQRAMREAADSSVFHLLCLIDNVAPVVDGFREELRLKVVAQDGVERDLNPEGAEYEDLHDIFRWMADESGAVAPKCEPSP